MEHVAFLIEESGVMVRCLLNPETLVVRRLAGVRTRRPTGGRQAGAGAQDDLIVFTGGGRTELDLDLLFDVDLPGSSPPAENVRDLTGPIWQLAENSARSQGTARPPQVRFLWGKAWNIPGVVLAIAERFESFTPTGVARRSWLRMRFLRVSDAPHPEPGVHALAAQPMQAPLPAGESSPGESSQIYQLLNLTEPAAEQPHESLPGLIDPNELLAQALQASPSAQQAAKEVGQAINALAEVVSRADLPPAAASELNKAVQEMQAAVQSAAPGTATPSLPPEDFKSPAAVAVQIATAQAAAVEALDGLPGKQAAVKETKEALNRLSPAVNDLGQAHAEVAEGAQKSAASLTASAAAQVLTLAGQAAEMVHGLPAAFDEVAAAAKQISAQGMISGIGDVLTQLDGIGPQLTTAWTKNNSRLAHHAMQALALAGHNLRAADAVFQAVSPGALLAKGLANMSACLQTFKDSQTGAQVAYLDALRRLEATAQVVLENALPKPSLPDGHSESMAVLEIAAQMRQALPLLGAAETSQAGVNAMQTRLDQLETLVKNRQAIESTQTADRVRAAAVQTSSKAAAPPSEWESPTERLDQIAYRYYGSPAYWRLLAQVNQIDNPLNLAPNQPLVIPPKPRVQGR